MKYHNKESGQIIIVESEITGGVWELIPDAKPDPKKSAEKEKKK